MACTREQAKGEMAEPSAAWKRSAQTGTGAGELRARDRALLRLAAEDLGVHLGRGKGRAGGAQRGIQATHAGRDRGERLGRNVGFCSAWAWTRDKAKVVGETSAAKRRATEALLLESENLAQSAGRSAGESREGRGRAACVERA